jgi:hypothetical protein
MPVFTLVLVAIFFAGAARTVSSAVSQTFGCSYPGQRGNVLVLVNRNGTSYVKMSGQQVPTSYASRDDEQTWSWTGKAVVLTGDGVARYYEGSDREAPKATFRCKTMG